jgi:hypothetical protein
MRELDNQMLFDATMPTIMTTTIKDITFKVVQLAVGIKDYSRTDQF